MFKAKLKAAKSKKDIPEYRGDKPDTPKQAKAELKASKAKKTVKKKKKGMK